MDWFVIPFRGYEPQLEGFLIDINCPHIMYRFTFVPNDDKTPILKYGISDVYRFDMMQKPESQLAAFRATYGSTVQYTVLMRTMNRAETLAIELELVGEHYKVWNAMPRAQIRPTIQ